ncbi:MAG: hypothetical protein H6920_00045 [Sphingomonadaceae bacterium]|nr:hypothetical protein [Sphingomonadaceae bacterium]
MQLSTKQVFEMNKQSTKSRVTNSLQKGQGRILPPLILWMLGVPGFVVVLLWLFFFRG